jgi:hypothetical protein
MSIEIHPAQWSTAMGLSQRSNIDVRTEVEKLLARILVDSDHYAVLGVGRAASIEEIRGAYCHAVEYLHPLNRRELIESDGAMRWKLSEAFLRVVEAFATLSRPARRIEYDGSLTRKPTTPLPIPRLAEVRLEPHAEANAAAAAEAGRRGNGTSSLGSVFGYGQYSAPRVTDRRRAQRLVLRLPVRVTSEDGTWQEVTTSQDVSRLGVKLSLSRVVEAGTLIRLELPLPKDLRLHSQSEMVYLVDAIVRHSTESGARNVVGVEFLSEAPSAQKPKRGVPR